MTQEKMTVHEALTALKTLDKRVTSAIAGSTYVTAVRHSSDTIGGKAIADVKTSIQADYDRVMDMIARRAAIRKALAFSNASTSITVGGKTYWVSEAIEMKRSGIALKQILLTQLTRQMNDVNRTIKNHNEDIVLKDAERHMSTFFSGKDKASADEERKARENYIAANTLDLVDPLDVKEKIGQLTDEIDAFNDAVDSALSVSNALTTITIEY